MNDWGFRIFVSMLVAAVVVFFTGMIFVLVKVDDETNDQFKRDCIALGGNPVIQRNNLCIKDSTVIFRQR